MTLLLLGLTLSAAADSLNATLTFASPAEEGQGHVQVEITSQDIATSLGAAPAPDRFRAIVGQGDARIDSVRNVGSSGEKVYTVMAFDRSGSFSRYWGKAFDLAEAMADALPADGSHTVEVMSFHGNQTFHGAASTSAGVRAILTEVEALGTLGSASETSLMSAVKDGARQAAEQQPTTGARQLIVFTDAGEEGAIFTLDETISAVRSVGTVVHPMVLKQVAAPGSNKARVFSKANDRMKKLAEESGGQHLHVQDLPAAKRLMVDHATVSERLYWLSLSYCAVPAGDIRFMDTIQIEVLQGSTVPAKTASAPFRQHAAGTALLTCADLPAAQAGTAAAEPEPPPTPSSSSDDTSGRRSWLWPLLGVGLLMLMLMGGGLMLFALLGGKKKEPPAPVEKPPPPEKKPDTTPTPSRPEAVNIIQNPGSTSASDLLEDPLAIPKGAHNPIEKALPETRLRIVQGPAGLEPYYRISSSPFTIGGGSDVDLTLDIRQISGLHATIHLYKLGAVFITDHSLNGTFLDGVRLKKDERAAVKPGQRIGLSQQLLVELEQPGLKPAPTPPPAAQPEKTPDPPVRRSRKKTVYGPISGATPPPDATQPAKPPARRSKHKTIIQPIRRDDES